MQRWVYDSFRRFKSPQTPPSRVFFQSFGEKKNEKKRRVKRKKRTHHVLNQFTSDVHWPERAPSTLSNSIRVAIIWFVWHFKEILVGEVRRINAIKCVKCCCYERFLEHHIEHGDMMERWFLSSSMSHREQNADIEKKLTFFVLLSPQYCIVSLVFSP